MNPLGSRLHPQWSGAERRSESGVERVTPEECSNARVLEDSGGLPIIFPSCGTGEQTRLTPFAQQSMPLAESITACWAALLDSFMANLKAPVLAASRGGHQLSHNGRDNLGPSYRRFCREIKGAHNGSHFQIVIFNHGS